MDKQVIANDDFMLWGRHGEPGDHTTGQGAELTPKQVREGCPEKMLFRMRMMEGDLAWGLSRTESERSFFNWEKWASQHPPTSPPSNPAAPSKAEALPLWQVRDTCQNHVIVCFSLCSTLGVFLGYRGLLKNLSQTSVSGQEGAMGQIYHPALNN